MEEKIKLDGIEEVIKDFREGKFVIVVDDEDREKRGRPDCRCRKDYAREGEFHVETCSRRPLRTLDHFAL